MVVKLCPCSGACYVTRSRSYTQYSTSNQLQAVLQDFVDFDTFLLIINYSIARVLLIAKKTSPPEIILSGSFRDLYNIEFNPAEVDTTTSEKLRKMFQKSLISMTILESKLSMNRVLNTITRKTAHSALTHTHMVVFLISFNISVFVFAA